MGYAVRNNEKARINTSILDKRNFRETKITTGKKKITTTARTQVEPGK